MSDHPFGGFDDEIIIAADVLLKTWWNALSVREPWRTMPADDAFGMMRRVLSELLNEGRDCDRGGREARMAAAARAHGAFRQAQRYPPRCLYEEFDVVIEASEVVMLEQGLSAELISDSLVLLEADVRRARESAFAGWMRSLSNRSSEPA